MVSFRTGRSRVASLAMLLVSAILLTGCTVPFTGEDDYEFFGGTFDPATVAAPINLTDQNGEAFSLDDLDGKVVLLYFGYTMCPDFCPTTLLEIQRVEEALGDDADNVEVVFVSVDPERDTQERLKEYMDFFNPEYIALRGSDAEIRDVARSYNIMYARGESTSAGGYLVDHTTSLFAIDGDGNLALTWAYGTDVESITKDIQHLIKN